MKTTAAKPARAKVASRPATRVASRAASPVIELTWPHFGVLYRLTTWPEVVLERQAGDGWEPVVAGASVIDSGAVHLDAAAWRRYLEFVPAGERAFLNKFRYGRLSALLMIARCPALLADLEESPALVAFLAAHAELRGTAGSRWDEMTAVHERNGVSGVLEWLGLPSGRQTLAVLRNLIDPDVPRHLLAPLRSLLWNPTAKAFLENAPDLTDRQLARYCHALAA